MVKHEVHRIRKENSNMNMDFTAEIYNEALIMIENLYLQIANKVLNQLGMPSPNRSVAASFDVELRREQSYNTADLFSYVQSHIPKLTFEQKGIYDQIMQTVNTGVGEILFLDAPGEIATCTIDQLRSSHIKCWKIGNGKLSVDLALGISLPYNLCNLVTSEEELIEESNIQSKVVTYKSVDTVEEADEAVNYPTEFLNSFDLPEMPSHVLQLKIGVPIIMLRNIKQSKLCNDTRLASAYEGMVQGLLLVAMDVTREKVCLYKNDDLFEYKVVSKLENNRWRTCKIPSRIPILVFKYALMEIGNTSKKRGYLLFIKQNAENIAWVMYNVGWAENSVVIEEMTEISNIDRQNVKSGPNLLFALFSIPNLRVGRREWKGQWTSLAIEYVVRASDARRSG
uniref:ATP-dependent DNA helicase n=1 Tax=Onchocerca volvulus TaxID=6282 RepID=A0A8R1XWJ1_ONCVO